jgi:hypothetical protein
MFHTYFIYSNKVNAGTGVSKMRQNGKNPWLTGLTSAGQPGTRPNHHVIDPGARKHTYLDPEPCTSSRFDQMTQKASPMD